MKDSRIQKFKRTIEEDNLISAGCCRFLLRLCSWRYCTQSHAADCEFALSAREVMAWYDTEGPEAIENEKTVWGWFKEAVLSQYLFFNGRAKHTPPKALYRLNLARMMEPLTLFHWGMSSAAQIAQKQYGQCRVRSEAIKLERSLKSKKRRTYDKVHTAAQTEVHTAAQTEVHTAAQTEVHTAGSVAVYTAAQTDPPNIVIPTEEKKKTKGKKSRSLRSQGGKELNSSLRSEMTNPTLLSSGGNGASTEGNVLRGDDRATSVPTDDPIIPRGGVVSPPKDARKSSVRPSSSGYPPEVTDEHLLFFARNKIALGNEHQLEDGHIRVLLNAGDTIPRESAEKFAALLEAHNPIPA